jgi:hypothetical protein
MRFHKKVAWYSKAITVSRDFFSCIFLVCFLFSTGTSSCDPEPASFFFISADWKMSSYRMIRNTFILRFRLSCTVRNFSCSSLEAYCFSWWQLPGSRSLLAEQAGTCCPLHQVSSAVFQKKVPSLSVYSSYGRYLLVLGRYPLCLIFFVKVFCLMYISCGRYRVPSW